LEDVEDEVLVQLAVGHLLRRLNDGLAPLPVEPAQLHVGLSRRPLDQPQGANEGPGEPEAADWEVEDRPLGRGAVVGPGRNLHGTHGVPLDANLTQGAQTSSQGVTNSRTEYPLHPQSPQRDQIHPGFLAGKGWSQPCTQTRPSRGWSVGPAGQRGTSWPA